MKGKQGLIAIVGFAAVIVTAFACGGDGEPDTNIRRGLSVALPSSAADASSGQSSETASAPGVSRAAMPPQLISKSDALGYSSQPAPYLQTGQTGLSVQGYGSASAAADQSVLWFYFNSGVMPGGPVPLPGLECKPAPNNGCTTIAPDMAQITRETLQPIIDAIKAQGIAEGDIRVDIQPVYYPADYGYGYATITVLVRNIDKTDAVVSAVKSAATSVPQAALANITEQYTLSECGPIERQARAAAAADARERAAALADTLDVGLGNIIGASQWSYAPYGIFGCDGDPIDIMYSGGGYPYSMGIDRDVEISAMVALTYEIK